MLEQSLLIRTALGIMYMYRCDCGREKPSNTSRLKSLVSQAMRLYSRESKRETETETERASYRTTM